MTEKALKEKYRMGIVAADSYRRYRPTAGYDWIKSIIVFAFPYQQQKAEGKYLPARFAYGGDYHRVVADILRDIAYKLKLYRHEVLVDRSFLDEKLAAYLAGLGFIGKNTLLITPEFGSYVFLGTIVTDYLFSKYDQPLSLSCAECNLCVNKCPTAALDDGFNRKICLSYLTQTVSEDFSRYDLLKDTYYGCDICQEVCPHNRHPKRYLPEFSFSCDVLLTLNDLENLNKEKYLEKYRDKNFSWIGYLKMLRNIIVLEVNNNNINCEKIEYFQKLYRDVPWFCRHMEYLKGKIKNES